jgi:hypothetical protein
MSLAIILAYGAILLLLLLALLWSRWPAWLKSLLVLAVTGLYFFGYDAVHAIWGVPSTDAMPARFVMLASVVEEPSSRAKGAIYLWVSEPQEGGPLLAPKAYKLPYSKDLHAQVEEGLRKGRDGIAQMGLAEAKAGAGKGGAGWLKPGNDEQEIKIRDLPSPALPEK